MAVIKGKILSSTTSGGGAPVPISNVGQVVQNATQLRALPGGPTMPAAAMAHGSGSDIAGGVFTWDSSTHVDDGVNRFNPGGLASVQAGWQRINMLSATTVAQLRGLIGGIVGCTVALLGDDVGGIFSWDTTNALDDGWNNLNIGGLASNQAGWRRLGSSPAFVSLTGPIKFDSELNTVEVMQRQRRSNTATASMFIKAQDAYGFAIGTNRDAGSIVLSPGQEVAGGAAGFVGINDAGANQLALFSNATIWLGPDQTSNLKLTSSAIGTIELYQGSTKIATFDSNGILLHGGYIVDETTVGSAIGQLSRSTDVAASGFLVKSQDSFASATGTNKNGSDLTLAPGAEASGGTIGKIVLGESSLAPMVTVARDAIVVGDGSATVKVAGDLAFYGGTPHAQPTISGSLSTVGDAAAKAVLTSIIAALKATTGVDLAIDGTT